VSIGLQGKPAASINVYDRLSVSDDHAWLGVRFHRISACGKHDTGSGIKAVQEFAGFMCRSNTSVHSL
jgi:hypothetical protein